MRTGLRLSKLMIKSAGDCVCDSELCAKLFNQRLRFSPILFLWQIFFCNFRHVFADAHFPKAVCLFDLHWRRHKTMRKICTRLIFFGVNTMKIVFMTTLWVSFSIFGNWKIFLNGLCSLKGLSFRDSFQSKCFWKVKYLIGGFWQLLKKFFEDFHIKPYLIHRNNFFTGSTARFRGTVLLSNLSLLGSLQSKCSEFVYVIFNCCSFTRQDSTADCSVPLSNFVESIYLLMKAIETRRRIFFQFEELGKRYPLTCFLSTRNFLKCYSSKYFIIFFLFFFTVQPKTTIPWLCVRNQSYCWLQTMTRVFYISDKLCFTCCFLIRNLWKMKNFNHWTVTFSTLASCAIWQFSKWLNVNETERDEAQCPPLCFCFLLAPPLASFQREISSEEEFSICFRRRFQWLSSVQNT